MILNRLDTLESGKIYDFKGKAPSENTFVINTDNVVIKNLAVTREITVNADNVTLDGCHADSITVSGRTNTLIARSVANTICVTDCYNCSIILNNAQNVICEANTNVYVIDNSIACKLAVNNNNYVIADGNQYAELCSNGNDNTNGNTLTDVDARVEVGANEDLLPHTNKELFVGMPRKTDVANSGLSVRDYIHECAKSDDSIIIPPGAYTVAGKISLGGEAFAGKTLYAYGAYLELDCEFKKYPDALLELINTHDVKVYGTTLGYVLPSCGQVRVVNKYLDGERCLLTVINDAGFLDGFTTTDPDVFHTWWPETFLYDEEKGEYRYYCEENPNRNHTTTRNFDENGNYDGTMTIELFDRGSRHYAENKPARDVWDRITPGTVMTCRLPTPCKASYSTVSAKNILLRDCVLYGYTAAMSAYAYNECENVHYVRYNDTAHSASIIDKQTYDKYKEYEKKFGVGFEVYQDENGRYRGAAARSSSVDAFHISKTKQGISITSSLLENMVDDGCNQHAASARLHSYSDNGDGTVTLIYKPLVSHSSWTVGKTKQGEDQLPTLTCIDFQKGHRIYVYNPYGRAICETEVLEDGIVAEDTVDIDLTYDGVHKHVIRPLYAVKVNAADVDFEALIDYKTGREFDLSDNARELTNRVSVDNLSFNCSGYTLDNVMVRNGHTRGFLIKAVDVNIKHCTFRNIPYSGLLLRPEWGWAESTVARRISISKCLFDHTGFMYQGVAEKDQACIRIQSTSTHVSEGTLPIKDISITGCKFTNNDQKLAIWINSAQNVTVKNNTFDPIVQNLLTHIPGTAVLLETCMNVDISDNTYNYEHYNGDINTVIKGFNYANIHGTDVTDKNGNALLSDSLTDN